jgi:hypothetical protein
MRAPPLDGLLSFAVGAALAVVVMRLAPPARAHLAPLLKVVHDARRHLGASVYVMHAKERRSERPVEAAVESPVAAASPSLTATAPSPSPSPTPSPTPSVEETLAGPEPSPTVEPVADLDGWWLVTHSVEAADHVPDGGLQLVYRLRLQQDGDQITGKGSTWAKNGRPLGSVQQTPVVASGTRRTDSVEMTLAEHGSRGVRELRLEWRASSDADHLEGWFVDAANNTSGRSEAAREPPPVQRRAP